MKLYLAAGEYVGTQAEARKLDREFEQIDVPNDKAGLIDFLNSPWQTNPSFVDDLAGGTLLKPGAARAQVAAGGSAAGTAR